MKTKIKNALCPTLVAVTENPTPDKIVEQKTGKETTKVDINKNQNSIANEL